MTNTPTEVLRPLLVTTAHNLVRQHMENVFPTLATVDCQGKGRTEVLHAVEGTPCNILITYRCPYILPTECFSHLPFGAYNIHPSLLPKYAGLNTWDAIFANHGTEGGVTLNRISSQVDQGEILLQQAFAIAPTDSITTARAKADALASTLLQQFLSSLEPR